MSNTPMYNSNNNKKYITQNNENQNHHQYCHWDKWIKISDLCVEKPKLKLVLQRICFCHYMTSHVKNSVLKKQNYYRKTFY